MDGLRQIAALRKKLGLTQAQLAESIGVEQSTVHRWENGKQEPATTHLIALGQALGVRVDALMGDYLPKGGVFPMTENSTPPDGRLVYRCLTGKDDHAFCERVSKALEEGWRLHGSPSITWSVQDNCGYLAQAVVWGGADVVKR